MKFLHEYKIFQDAELWLLCIWILFKQVLLYIAWSGPVTHHFAHGLFGSYGDLKPPPTALSVLNVVSDV